MVGKQGDPGVSGRNNRLFIEAVLWHISEKCGWSKLPSEFGGWNSIYMRFRRWDHNGCWRQMVVDLSDDKELSGLIKRIVSYADQQAQSVMRRKTRKAEREIYSKSVTHIRKKMEALDDSEEDSHWLSLVGAI